MGSTEKTTITVQTTVNANVEKVWNHWTRPEHITGWNFASDDWHAPRATNDVRVDGKFNWRMEAKDGSAGFDFEGIYSNVQPHKLIEYAIIGGRKVKIVFAGNEMATVVTETFEAEETNPIEMQKAGWQSILNNFKKHVESR